MAPAHHNRSRSKRKAHAPAKSKRTKGRPHGGTPDFSQFFGDIVANIFDRPEGKNEESGQDPIREIPIEEICPSPENDQLYRPVDPADPEIVGMADSIKQYGMVESLRGRDDFRVLPADGIGIRRTSRRP
jgi:hypothetical protein